MFKVNGKNTRTSCEIYSHVSIVNFDRIFEILLELAHQAFLVFWIKQNLLNVENPRDNISWKNYFDFRGYLDPGSVIVFIM